MCRLITQTLCIFCYLSECLPNFSHLRFKRSHYYLLHPKWGMNDPDRGHRFINSKAKSKTRAKERKNELSFNSKEYKAYMKYSQIESKHRGHNGYHQHQRLLSTQMNSSTGVSSMSQSNSQASFVFCKLLLCLLGSIYVIKLFIRKCH
jgi:hypothetical protein